MKQDLISSWGKFDHTRRPLVLRGDIIPDEFIRQYHSWEGFIEAPDFDADKDNKLQLDLFPIPFIGNLKTASLFLLMLNPGFGPHDYFGEYKIPEYRNALVANIQQRGTNSFLFLDPRFSWHGGYKYWHSKLHQLIKSFALKSAVSYEDARTFFQRKVAVIELVPYHSNSFSLPDRVIEKLKSVELARAYVKERAEDDDCMVVVTRSAKKWGLSSLRNTNIIHFDAQQARGAHLSCVRNPILRFLQRRFEAE